MSTSAKAASLLSFGLKLASGEFVKPQSVKSLRGKQL
jgi:hypothetical protein